MKDRGVRVVEGGKGTGLFRPCLFCPSDNFETCVLRSGCADVPRYTHFPTDICSVIQEGEITVEKCAHHGASASRERHTLSLGQNKHGHNNSAPEESCKILVVRDLPEQTNLCHPEPVYCLALSSYFFIQQ